MSTPPTNLRSAIAALITFVVAGVLTVVGLFHILTGFNFHAYLFGA